MEAFINMNFYDHIFYGIMKPSPASHFKLFSPSSNSILFPGKHKKRTTFIDKQEKDREKKFQETDKKGNNERRGDLKRTSWHRETLWYLLKSIRKKSPVVSLLTLLFASLLSFIPISSHKKGQKKRFSVLSYF